MWLASQRGRADTPGFDRWLDRKHGQQVTEFGVSPLRQKTRSNSEEARLCLCGLLRFVQSTRRNDGSLSLGTTRRGAIVAVEARYLVAGVGSSRRRTTFAMLPSSMSPTTLSQSPAGANIRHSSWCCATSKVPCSMPFLHCKTNCDISDPVSYSERIGPRMAASRRAAVANK